MTSHGQSPSRVELFFTAHDPVRIAAAGFDIISACITPGTLHDAQGKPLCIHAADGTIKGTLCSLVSQPHRDDSFKPVDHDARLTIIPTPFGPAWAWHVSASDDPLIEDGDWTAYAGPAML